MLNEEKEMTIEEFFKLTEDGGLYEIETPQGWKKLKDLVKKHKKDCYKICLGNGMFLEGSNDHLILIGSEQKWVALKDVKIGDMVHTENGLFSIISINYIGENDTFDFEVDSEEHAYYSNGIVSHNTGKTMIAKVFAKEIPATVIYVLPSHMERAADINRVCEMAKELAPTMIILEDLDYIAQDRNETYNSGNVIQLMNQMDGVQEFADIITFATTNEIEKIEKAIKNRPGRFDRVVTINKPDQECKVRMLEKFTSTFVVDNSIDFDKIASEFADASGAHMKDLCVTAAFHAIKSNSVNSEMVAIIKEKHFEKALAEIQNIDYSTYLNTKNRRKIGFGSYDE